MRWILVVPDCPMMEDFYDIAEDINEYADVVKFFWEIVEDMVKEDTLSHVYNHLRNYNI